METEVARYWQHAAVDGVDLLRARYVTHRYGRHSHETYTFGLIEAGVEEFDYGSSVLRAGPGAVALLNPDVVHTGHAATPVGWTYRVLYPQVSVVTAVAAELGWRKGTPRFPETVLYDEGMAALLRSAHRAAEHGDRLASSTLLTRALAGLLRAHATVGTARSAGPAGSSRAGGAGALTGAARAGVPAGAAGLADGPRAPAAVGMVRDLLAERLTEPPSLAELAALTGLSQFSLLRAFRAATGLPPHAYLNQLRVRRARLLLGRRAAASRCRCHDRLRGPGTSDPALQARRRRAARGLPARAAAARRIALTNGKAPGAQSGDYAPGRYLAVVGYGVT